MNNTKKKPKFIIKTDSNGVKYTQCVNEENEEQILAIMAENINDSFEEPMFLEKDIGSATSFETAHSGTHS